MTFAAASLALCGLAARTLGWRPHDFWAATPAELAAALGLLSPGATSGFDRDALTSLMAKLREDDHG
ncbi:phage tail assembly chaperone [Novosphingobium guangzhouense]|uniref:Phage tail assembly chaperone n=1 Tax=Novosphingobium guangzhouense TaxID=1850347 RepID=A0A2K2G0S1_9SPHN|nr:phage tail assembly chaperone [Novosphingobium guangzhouense]PNU04649.1 hypothetical protein A8V01_18785 [Novosphingobium guangzhouense]